MILDVLSVVASIASFSIGVIFIFLDSDSGLSLIGAPDDDDAAGAELLPLLELSCSAGGAGSASLAQLGGLPGLPFRFMLRLRCITTFCCLLLWFG
jgi:hypothetical protein